MKGLGNVSTSIMHCYAREETFDQIAEVPNIRLAQLLVQLEAVYFDSKSTIVANYRIREIGV